MMRRAKRTQSLATNVVLLTFVLAMLSVSIVSLAALVGVYDLGRTQISAQHAAYLQAVSGDVALRLEPASRLVSRALAVSVDTNTGEIDHAALRAQFDTGIEFVDQLFVVDRDGTVVGAYPTFLATRAVEYPPLVGEARSDETVFFYRQPGGAEDSRLWAARAADGDSGLVMVARVRTGFLQPIVDRFSNPSIGRSTLLVEVDGPAVVSGAGPSGLVMDSVIYEPDEQIPSQGTVSGIGLDESVVWGHYLDIEGFGGLQWRAVVVEPRSTMVTDAVRSLAPAVIALVASGVTTLILVWFFARRMLAPLTHLEVRVRDAVSGAYVRPLPSDRTDEIGRLSDAFNAIALRLNALHDLSQLLASSSRLDQVLDGILSAMGHIVGTATVAVFLVDEQEDALVLARVRDLAEDATTNVPLERGSWLVESMFASDPDVRIASAEDIAALVPGEYRSFVTVLTAPLVVGTEPLGVVLVIEDGPRTFSEAEIEMVRTFSAQAAVAVHNSRLFEVETRSRTEAESLRTVAEQLARPNALCESLDSVRDVAAILLRSDSTVFAVADREEFGLPPSGDVARERLVLETWDDLSDEAYGTVLVGAESPGPAHELLRALGATRGLLAAVMMDGTTRAVLVFMRVGERPFTVRDRRLAEALANQLSLAFESSYYFQRANTRAVNLETVFRISQAVGSSLQTKVVLNRVLDVVQKIFAADAIMLMTYDRNSGRIVTEMARGMISPEMLHFETESGEPGPGAVFASGELARIALLRSTDTGLSGLAYEQGLRSSLAVPLLARGRSIGVLTVFSSVIDAFSEEDMGLLHTFASQAALAIDNAKLYSTEHMVASVLQASILPQTLPTFPELEASSIYLPGGVEADIGGDYFDLFASPQGTIFMVIGDVCGKGVVAATKTSMIKYSLRGLAAAGLTPERIISEVNQMVSETEDTGDIVTLWIGEFDAVNGVLSYANGGHPAALLKSGADGSIRRLPPTGALLGASAAALYEQERLKIEPGDLLLLYTDGVTEARRGNKFFGEGRVERVLRRSVTATEVTQQLLASLEKFAHGAIRDDAAVLAVRIIEGPADASGNRR